MPDKSLYPMIFKRKSFHLFRNCGNETITAKECKEIEEAYLGFEALYPEISTAIRIVPADRTTIRSIPRFSQYRLSMVRSWQDERKIL